MKELTMKKVGIASIVVIAATIICLASQLIFARHTMANLNIQSLVVDTLRMSVVAWLCFWARKALKNVADR